ncbi:class II aldolase/adducin family protein [Thermoplasmatales archaeon AK]|nr:class II aldolase/adducin family protein [Thermoplasmatales archaeon AK]
MEELELLKEKLAIANRILVSEELTELGRGHVSYKLSSNEILIPGHLHDYNRSIADCNAGDIVTIDYEGNVVEGNYPESMHEFHFYSAVYRKRQDVHSALHMHAFYTNLLAISNMRLRMATRDAFLFLDGLPVFAKLPLFVNTPEMGTSMAETLGKCRAVVHRGHGAFVVGKSIEDAVITAASLERACKKQVLSPFPDKLLEYEEKEIRLTDTEEIRREVSEIDWGYFTTRLFRK